MAGSGGPANGNVNWSEKTKNQLLALPDLYLLALKAMICSMWLKYILLDRRNRINKVYCAEKQLSLCDVNR